MENLNVGTLPYEVQQIMAIYNLNNEAGTREGLIAVLGEMRGYINPNDDRDKELLEHTDAALQLLRKMSDAEFAELDLTVDFLS